MLKREATYKINKREDKVMNVKRKAKDSKPENIEYVFWDQRTWGKNYEFDLKG